MPENIQGRFAIGNNGLIGLLEFNIANKRVAACVLNSKRPKVLDVFCQHRVDLGEIHIVLEEQMQIHVVAHSSALTIDN